MQLCGTVPQEGQNVNPAPPPPPPAARGPEAPPPSPPPLPPSRRVPLRVGRARCCRCRSSITSTAGASPPPPASSARPPLYLTSSLCLRSSIASPAGARVSLTHSLSPFLTLTPSLDPLSSLLLTNTHLQAFPLFTSLPSSCKPHRFGCSSYNPHRFGAAPHVIRIVSAAPRVIRSVPHCRLFLFASFRIVAFFTALPHSMLRTATKHHKAS